MDHNEEITYTSRECIPIWAEDRKVIRIKEGVNILELLAGSGFTAYELRKQGIIGEARIQKLRRGELPTMRELNFICWATAYSVGELLEYKDNGAPWETNTEREASKQ